MANNRDQVDYSITTIPSYTNDNNLTKRNVNSSNEAALNESVPDVENKASKQPKNTALKQQRLPAWQPVLTAKTVFPLFFGIGVIFIVLGAVLLSYSNLVNEKVIDYTNCLSNTLPNTKCSDISNTSLPCACNCTISFSLDADFTAPVYLYYGLKNFYQNHRRYVKSRDDYQLLGRKISPTSLNSECTPYGAINDSLQYAPCGAIANSLFNDSFVLKNLDISSQVPLLATEIAWTTDKNVKFQNPSDWNNTIQPKNWQKPVYELSSDPNNNGYKNEDLIVWMRTAALPSFRKFYRRVDHASSVFTSNLPKGNYTLNICYNYPVTVFGGSKSFIISTTTWIGGKNPFLGIAYLVVGSTCIVLGCVFLIIHFKFSRNAKPMDDYNSKSNIATVELPNRH